MKFIARRSADLLHLLGLSDARRLFGVRLEKVLLVNANRRFGQSIGSVEQSSQGNEQNLVLVLLLFGAIIHQQLLLLRRVDEATSR
ncbi:hypothetical protein TYRP_010988 [Tyrophagus putrescentiae]|nr:hypothetical protein TYRP_010988 [Tyrophagus putrescentiae]